MKDQRVKWAIIRQLTISLVGLLGLFLALQYLNLFAAGTAPVFVSTTTSATAQNKVAYTYIISATDPENDALTFSAPTLPSWLTLSGTAPVINRADFVPSSAGLSGPTGITRGSDGSIYIADTGNHCIRKVNAAGTMTTFAGTCQATAGTFDTPTALAFDSTGNLYVTEGNADRVSKVTPDGTVSALVTDTNFNYPSGITLDTANNIYVSAGGANGYCVSKIARTGTTYATSASTFAGQCATSGFVDDSTGTTARFNSLSGLTTDGTNLYVVDTGNLRIRKIDGSGAVTTLAGDGTTAVFDDPRGIAYDPAGYLYVTEGAGKKIRRITVSTGLVSTFYDGSTSLNTAEQLVRAPNGDLFIPDSGSNVIHKVSITGPTLSGTPSASNEGANSVTISVSDGGTPVNQTFTINVTNNHATISGTPSSTTLLIGDNFSFTPTTTSDPDGDTLTFSIANKPDWATFNTSTGALTGQPPAADSKTGIVISVTDGGTPVSLAAFNLTVLAPSPTPTNTDTPTNTPTNTDTPTTVSGATPSPTNILTATVSGATPSPTSILTATVSGTTPTFTNTPLPTLGEGTPSPLPTNTALRSPTNTSTPSLSPTKTPTPSNTPTPVPSLVADVESVQSGKWNASSTWKDGNIPQKTNVVKINKAHEITLDSSVEINELQNEGTLRGLNEKLLLIAVNRSLYNRGNILSKDGDSSSRNGAALVLQGSFLQNESQIKAGKGLDGDTYGGNGGSIQIEFDRVENKASAVILAGGGGSASKGKVGGIGGNISLKSQNTSQLLSGDSLVNEGQIQAGKGGTAIDSGTAVVTTTAIAGDGGSIETNFATLTNATGAKVLAGDGGSVTHDSTMVGNGKGIGGRGGSIISKGGSKASFTLSSLLAEDELPANSFNNTGTFQAGNGGASSYVSGAGGDLSIAAKEVKNAGTLWSGLGGGIIPGGQNSSSICGRGGNLRVSGGSQKTTTLTSQTLLNTGLVRAGSGGSIITRTFLTQTSVITGVTGGNGGGVEITAANTTNKGQVQAGDGGQGNWGGSGGNSKIGGSTLINEGSIQGGNGGDSDLESGDGGGIELSATLIDNAATGQLIAGIGGGTKTTALAETGNGDGLSGNVSARSDGSISSKGKITVKSKISALDLLQCQKGLLSKTWCKKISQEKEVEQQKLKIVAIQKHSSSGNMTDTVSLGGKISVAGKFQIMAASDDSQQVAGGIKISGSDTSIEAGSLEVATGPGMSIGLEDMAPGAIKVDTDVTLAVGPGGSIGLQGMTGVISATKVNLAADKIETGGVDLNTLVGNKVEKLSARVLGHANFSQTPPLHTTPGQDITTTVSLFNDSPALNTFIFTVTKKSASWTLTGLPKTQVITGFASANLQLVFSPPSKADVGEETSITVETQAQENPSTQASYSFKIALEVPAAAPVVELLQPTPTPTPTATPTPTVTPTPSPIPTLTAPCACPLKWLIQGNCNSTLAATLAQSQTLDLNIFYKVRDLLKKSAAGQEYVALYEKNGPEITNLLISDAALRAKTLQTLLLWQPQFQALVAAQSGSVQTVEAIITAELTKSADSLLQDLAAKGSPALQQVVKDELLAKNPPSQLVGKTITQAQSQVVPPGWKVYLPLVQR